MYVDESRIDRYLTRTHCRALRGQSVIGEVSGKRYARQSFVAGKVGQKIIAPMTYEGTCHSAFFEAWVEKILVPELSPGQVIIMDNATFHKSCRTRTLIEGAGCTLLFLPPYSPDLNPIEQFWAWFKGQIREIIHTCKTLQDAINQIFLSCNA